MAKYNLSTQPYKGTRDFYPEDMRLRNWIFDHMKRVCRSYGYEEYDGPMLESFDLYAAKSGEEIVNNEIYSFEDKGHRKVAIRPEMTPTVARMVAAKIYELPKPIRWFSIPNLWRYEAPQRGRLREHWQLNVDVFGIDSLDAEVEIIQLARDVMLSFGATSESFECKINNRKLMDSAFDKIGILPSADGEQRYKVSKAIDKKAKISEEDFEKMLFEAGCDSDQIKKLYDYLESDIISVKNLVGEEDLGYQELKTLMELFALNDLNSFIKYSPSLMRGFDYYTGTVFEFYDTDPQNRRSLFGGGRYDDLVAIFNGQRISAFGFGMGDVTARDFLETHNLVPSLNAETLILVTTMDDSTKAQSFRLAEELRKKSFNVALYPNSDKLEKQLKYADQKKIQYAIILGSDEISQNKVRIKDLFNRKEDLIDSDKISDYIF